MVHAQRIAMHASLSEPHIDSSTYVCMSIYACMSCNKCRVVQIAYQMFLVHGKNDSIHERSNNFILQVLNNEITEQV